MWKARDGLARVTSIVDESHFTVRLLRCADCGQRFASVFCETIDWVGGNDPQDCLTVPVTEAEEAALVAAGEAGMERALRTLAPDRWHAHWFPSDGSAHSAWCSGAVRVPPHD
jgi:hypothetical protein